MKHKSEIVKKMNETNDKTTLEIDYNKTERIEVNIHDLVAIKKFEKDIENSNGVWNTSYRDILFTGQKYLTMLRDEFIDGFCNEEKFEHDFKMEVSIRPNTTRSYFKKNEILRLNKVNQTIKNCFRESDFYRLSNYYVGMCSYFEFLENYNPIFTNQPEIVNIESFISFGEMANYLFNHKLLIFENKMFSDPKTIKFQFICWEQIIQIDFDRWLHGAKGFQRFAGDSYDGYLTMNNMYDFAKWYNENIQLQEKNNKEFSEQELKRVGLLNDNVQISDSNIKGKTKQKGENMDLDLLDVLVNLKMTVGEPPTPLDLLKKDLRANVFTYNGKQITALADVIFKSRTLNKATKQPDFSVWLKQFCKIIDVKVPTSKQNAVIAEYNKLKDVYWYLIP